MDSKRPGLAMSRSIGDLIAKLIGVTYEPVITTYPLSLDHLFIIIASDGVWEVLEPKEASNFVEKYRCPLDTSPSPRD